RVRSAWSSGWVYGIAFGFLIWMAGPPTLIESTIGPRLLGRPALALLASHLVAGLALGTLYPAVHAPLKRPLSVHSRKIERITAAHLASTRRAQEHIQRDVPDYGRD